MSGTSVGRADLDLGINYGAFKKEVNNIPSKAGGMLKSPLGKLAKMAGVAFAVKGLFDFGSASVKLASDLQEVQNVVDVTFGGMAAEINSFSKTAITAFGMSELSTKKYASTMGAMLKSSGLTGQSMTNMSKSLTQLTGDMASFYNLDHDEAFQKLQAGMSGETEPLKRLGINMNVANLEAYALKQGITQSYNAMDQASQTLLKYNYIMQATTDAQGDFARTSGSWANQVRILQEQWKSFMSTMGSAFIAILTPVIRWLNFLISKLQIAAEYFKAFVEMITGVKQQSSSAAASVSDMSSGLGDVAKDAKKAGKAVKGSLAPFDQLNTLTKSTSESLGDMAGGAAGISDIGAIASPGAASMSIDIDTSSFDKMKGKMNDIKGDLGLLGQAIKNAFGPSVREAIDLMVPELAAWKLTLSTAFTDLISSIGGPLKTWLITDLVPFWATQITNMAIIFTGLSSTARMVFTDLFNAALPVLTWFVTDGLPIVTDFALGVTGLFTQAFGIIKTLFDTMWQDAARPGLTLLSTMVMDVLTILSDWWSTWSTTIFDLLSVSFDLIAGLFTNLWENFLKPIVTEGLETLSWLWDNHIKILLEVVAEFVGQLIDDALTIINEFIIPLINMFVDKFGPSIANTISFVIDVVGTLVGAIADVISGVIKVIGGLITFLTGVFTGDWERAWKGIVKVFEGIFTAVGGIFKGVINLVIDGMNYMIRSINKVKFTAPDWMPGIGGETFGINIREIPKLAGGGIITSPTLAMMGEGNKKEAVVPLENSDFLNTFAQTIAAAIAPLMQGQSNQGGGSNDDSTVLVLKIGETEFGRIAVKSIRKLQRQTGAAQVVV